MHFALEQSFYGASKMARVTLGRKAPQSNQAAIKVGFHFRHNKNLLKRVLSKLADYSKEGETACSEK